MEFHTHHNLPTNAILQLYNDVAWTLYTKDPEQLMRAIQNSRYVLSAWDGDVLVALLRAVGDGETILYIQDILVLQAYQGQGIGSTLMEIALEAHAQVRQVVLITDQDTGLHAFYRTVGMKEVSEIGLSGFVRINPKL
jgi:GNAT superfamily N-acetyltransferase